MKKIVLAVLFFGVCVSVFAQNALIREVSGTVELKNAGSAAFVPAKAGDRVAEDTIISTALRSNALLEIGSTLITVRPLTRLSLTEIRAAQGTETLNVDLQAGRVRVDVNPPAGTRASMAVSAPSATASVRGTSFEFDTRNISVSDGIVYFKGSRGYTFHVGSGSIGYLGARNEVLAYNNSAGNQHSSPVSHDGRTGTAVAPATASGSGNDSNRRPAPPPDDDYWVPPPGNPSNPSNPGTPNQPQPGGSGGGDIGIEY